MNAKTRAEYIDRFMNNCLGLLANKGSEYSRGEADVNSNFKRVAEAIGSDPISVAYVYFLKHIDSITNYVKTRETPSGEPIEGRLHDAVNYLAIIGSLIEESNDLRDASRPGAIYFHTLDCKGCDTTGCRGEWRP